MAVFERKLTSSGRRAKREALRDLARTHASALLSYCRRRLRDHHLAEDAVQEVFFRAYRHLAADEVADVSAWLFGVARRCCQEIARKRRRFGGGPGVLQDVPDPAGTPDDPPAELSVTLGRALKHLDDAERSLIYMKHTQGMKCRQIARATGKPLGTVTSRLSRAYRKLRSFMPEPEREG